VLQIFDCAQNSDEWFEYRRGIPTASAFSKVLAKGEGLTRREYMMKLAGEIITGKPMKNYRNDDMDRGHEWEPEARDLYAFETGASLQRVGFARNGRCGCSPDSLIGEDGGLEIKTAEAHILADIIDRDEFPSRHKAQVQGTLWVLGRQWWDLLVYSRDMPPFIKRVKRDEKYIQSLATEIDRFNAELDSVVAKISARGEAVAA
jgi:YqaJ-like viral recombinase domain